MVRGAREHNLKNISVAIPRNRLTVITGLSGSGKSSLAFDTIYAEGQRRYVESLSAYARQFLGLMEKPDVDAIEGLSPAISIEQKTTGQNPRSTVGTVTEIYDYLRLLWARVGVPHCPNDGTPVTRQSASQITDTVLGWPAETRIEVLAPMVRGRKGEFRELLDDVQEAGVRAGAGGRRDLRPGRGAGAQPPAESRRLGGGGPAGRPRRGPLAAQRFDRDRAQDGGRSGRGGAGRGGGRPFASLFSERFACPVCGLVAPGARAASVLLQLALRRMPRLPRRRHPPRSERRPGARRSQHLDPRGRHPPLGRAERVSPQGGAAHARQGLQVRPQRALG